MPAPLGPLRKAPRDLVPSWDLSLRYQFRPGIQPYVRVASSFRAPSIQGRLLFSDEVTVADTEDIISVEVGLKLRLWQQRLHFDLAAYHFWMNDQQLTAVGGDANVARLVNADRTIGRGLRLSWRWSWPVACALPPAPVTIIRGLTTRVCSSPRAARTVPSWTHPGPVPGTVSIDGNRLYQAPRWIVNFSLDYTYVLAGGSTLIASTDWAYRSRINFFLYDSREFRDDHRLEGGGARGLGIAFRCPGSRSLWA